jgi:hypothetical protein
VLHILALSRCAVIVRHWFEIDLSDCSLEHGARIELRERPPQSHRGSESAAQVIPLDRPLWRADLFDLVDSEDRAFGAAHYHPRFNGNEPCGRVWDPALTADPWRWLADQLASLGTASGHKQWPLDPDDASDLPMLADQIVTLAREFSPHRCRSAAECFRMTRDVREAVQLMIDGLEHPELLDIARVSPWMTTSAARA